jgi:SAM-dependent methyltransferase
VESIPTSSCILHTTREAAVAQPIGDLELGVCHRCGFIQNVRFDPSAVDYLAPYEESQGSSATFMRFVHAELDRLASTYELAGPHILDVGCGKAEWLAAACRVLGATGTGIDPAYLPGRVGEEDAARFDVITEFFDGSSDLHADLVACRHTLEHVANVNDMMRWLGDAADGSPGVVFIEVPDTLRILREGAFWDVYYEHAAYFTEASLRNLVRSAGMEVARFSPGFGDQYLLADIIAGRPELFPVPAARGGGIGYPVVLSGAEPIVEASKSFAASARDQIHKWQQEVDAAGPDRTVVWAATSKTVAFLSAIDRPVAAAIDINPAKHASFLPGSGTPVVSPERLTELQPDLVIVMNPIYLDEITADITERGHHSTILALGGGS